MRGIILGVGLAQGTEESGTPPVPYSNTKSIVLDGIDEYLDCGTPAAFGGTGNFSASVWFKSDINYACDLFGKWGGLATRDWVIYMSGGTLHAYFQTSTTIVNAATLQAYNDNQWHLAVITYDGSDLTIDVDGGLDRQSTAATSRAGNAGSRTYIGGRDNGSGGHVSSVLYFGNLDEVTFWSDALTAAECIELYNNGTPIEASTHSAAANLVSWYRMGDASGDSTDSADPSARVNDVKGSNDATPVNTESSDIVTVVPPSFNRLSLLVDGTNEDASLAGGSVTGCEFNHDSPMSVSAWFKSTQSSGAGIIASKMVPTGTQRGWSFGVYNGKSFFALHSSVSGGQYMQVYVDQYITTGAWKHLVVVYDGSGNSGGVTFYLNGQSVYPQGQTTQSYIDTIGGNDTRGGASAPLVLGSQSSSSGYFNGSFDEVTVWSKALSGVEVDTMYNAGTPTDQTGYSDLDAYYRCGEAAGDSATGTIHDVSGNSNDLTANNMEVADVQAPTPRPFWNLLSIGMDGVDERLYSNPASNAPAYDSSDTFSVSLWVKTSSSTFGGLVTKQAGSGNYRGWGLYVNPTGSGEFGVQMYHALGSNQINLETTNNGWNDGNWHHVVLTYDGSSTAAGLKIAVDGVNQAITVNADSLSNSITGTTALSIGSRGLVNAFYNGRVDEVSLYSATLTSTQITELYNGGKPRDAQTLTSAPSLDAYYRCGDDTFDAKAGGQATVFDKTPNNYHLWQANMEQADFDLDTP